MEATSPYLNRPLRSFSQFIQDTSTMTRATNTTDLDTFTTACFEAAEWTEELEGIPWNLETRVRLAADCQSFWYRFGCFVDDAEEATPEQAGHDFWLTRNGHGAGYWDRPEIYGDCYAALLTKAAEFYGAFELISDDGTEISG